MSTPTKLTNIGPKSAAWLRQVGVRTEEDLRALGAVGVFLKVKRAGFKPSLNLLYALAGAELGVHWASLEPDYKAQLVAQVTAFDEAAKLKKKFVTPARDVPLENYGQSGDGEGSSEVVDTDPGLFDSADGDDSPGSDGGSESGGGGGDSGD